ncbi:MAG: hypothetical protein WCY58_13970 [Mariniphaga sp.]|nr:hypothetical protein [Mariniphaga sp.]
MKRKLLILLSLVIFTIIAAANFNFKSNNHSFSISMADLAVMAYANGEQMLPCECGDLEHYRCYAYVNKCACLHDPEVQNPPVNCKNNIPQNCDC